MPAAAAATSLAKFNEADTCDNIIAPEVPESWND